MTRGISLEPGTVVVLSLDGTMVFVEDLQTTYAAVIALPEQPTQRADDRVFTPGRVSPKRISPFSTFDRLIPRDQLSPRNAAFLETYEDLRDKHGPHYVARTPEEEAAMSVTKVQPPRGKRAAKRAEARLAKCATCDQQPGHPNHPGDHEFVPPASTADSDDQHEEAAPTRTPRQPRSASVQGAAARYTLVNEDLTAARAQPRGDKYNVGNRSHRVVLALASLPGKSGTLDEVIAALCADGQTPPSNPEKITRRTLNQLATEEFGSCVTR